MSIITGLWPVSTSVCLILQLVLSVTNFPGRRGQPRFAGYFLSMGRGGASKTANPERLFLWTRANTSS